jgi:hypothetical protein
MSANGSIAISSLSDAMISLCVQADNGVPFGWYLVTLFRWNGTLTDKVAAQSNGYASNAPPGPIISILTGGASGDSTSYRAAPAAQVNNEPTGAASLVELALGSPANIAPRTYTFSVVDESQHQNNVPLIIEAKGYATRITESRPQVYSITRNRTWIASPVLVSKGVECETATAHCSG